ncbi:MAG: glycosyl hydrolase family 95 catalytic domain-containing protein [Opitutales bacterium]
MKLRHVSLLLLATGPLFAAPEHVIWFDAPAADAINEGLPLGNGRMGLLLTGGVARDRLPLNEDSVWSGWPNPAANRPAAAKALDEIRALMFAGRLEEAQALVSATQTSALETADGHHVGEAYGTFQMLAFLDLAFRHPTGAVSDYRRALDLSTGIATVEYRIAETSFRREAFVSHPDEVMVLRFTASTPGALDFSATLSRPDSDASLTVRDDTLWLHGRFPRPEGPAALAYGARLAAETEGGSATLEEDAIVFDGCDTVTLYLTAGTNYRGHRAWPDFLGRDFAGDTAAALKAARAQPIDALRAAHVADHTALFGRLALDLGKTPPAQVALPTPARLAALQAGARDPGLEALYFQFGRYLLIASSRPNGLAANLQGLWSAASRESETSPYNYYTPWNGDYHANINVQMNYWPVHVANLSECAGPLLDLIEGMHLAGRATAEIQHGAGGWTVHTVHNVWGHTAPGWVASWGHFPMGGPWMARHLAEHYAFTRDRDTLEANWPALRGAARFALDWLVEDPATGLLVSGPAGSPENRFLLPSGETGYFCMGPTMDQMIAHNLFANLLEAAAALGEEAADPLLDEVRATLPRLAGPRVGPDGRLLEWAEPFEEAEPGHRHVSHLYGLHPARQIHPLETPDLAAAAEKTLAHRLAHGGAHTGWSRAWMINFYARLLDGETAHHHLEALLAKSTLPNLFDTHPPFQIDGNFGATAGILEMLLQSHRRLEEGGFELHLLPALPTVWPEGSVRGLRARSGLSVDLAWADGRLARARLTADEDCTFRLRLGDDIRTVKLAAGEVLELGPTLTP